MSYIGDFTEDYATLNTKFTTVAGGGASTVLAGSPIIKCYAANETGTEVTTGITLSVDFDSVVGLNNVLVDLSSAAFYATGKDYQLIITTGTVDSVSVVGYVIAEFSIENRFMRGTDSAATSAAILTTALVESYSTKASAPTLTQAILEIIGELREFDITSKTKTIKKLDGTATAYTDQLNDDKNPTAIERKT